LTLCYSEGCDNNTLITVTPNIVKFKDLHGDLIQLTRASLYPSTLVGANLISDLLSENNKNGTVLPGVDFNQSQTYVDLSNPLKTRPFVTAIKDPNYQWGKFREMNKTSTSWNIKTNTTLLVVPIAL
jgi:hypothetical protein